MEDDGYNGYDHGDEGEAHAVKELAGCVELGINYLPWDHPKYELLCVHSHFLVLVQEDEKILSVDKDHNHRDKKN